MLYTPGETRVPGSKVSEPSGCGASAARLPVEFGFAIGPPEVQFVSTQLTVTVPTGVTIQDCVALPPEEVVASAVKLLETRDSAAAGVQLIVLPLRVAPIGAASKEKLTVPPDGSLAASV